MGYVFWVSCVMLLRSSILITFFKYSPHRLDPRTYSLCLRLSPLQQNSRRLVLLSLGNIAHPSTLSAIATDEQPFNAFFHIAYGCSIYIELPLLCQFGRHFLKTPTCVHPSHCSSWSLYLLTFRCVEMDLPTAFLVWKCLALIAFGMYTYVHPPNYSKTNSWIILIHSRRWEIIILLPFDISLLLGRRTFRWPLVRICAGNGFWVTDIPFKLIYVICRYSFFATIALLWVCARRDTWFKIWTYDSNVFIYATGKIDCKRT